MKQKLLALSITLVLFSGFVWADRASAWTATILAKGEDLGSANVVIGVASEGYTIPAPPPAPDTVIMNLYRPWGTALAEDIRQEGNIRYTWILSVNPNGDMVPLDPARTATLIWDPTDFITGIYYELREGYGGTGPIVVADMRTTTSYDVVGMQGFQFFTIVGVVPIPGAIWLLGSGLIGILGVRKKFKK